MKPIPIEETSAIEAQKYRDKFNVFKDNETCQVCTMIADRWCVFGFYCTTHYEAMLTELYPNDY